MASKVIGIVGGGAAGLMAALRAAKLGATVILFEKMSEPGRKILISGKGRCNITNDCDREGFIKAFGKEGRFLYSSWDALDNQELRRLLAEWGCPTVVERGQRVFPESQSAREVRDLLVQQARKAGADIRTDWTVKDIERTDDGFTLTSQQGKVMKVDRLILATGGLSYPGTGSTGDGYQWAKKWGHKIAALRPALVPLVTAESWVPELQGLSLRNVECSLWQGGKKRESEFGEMLFTHFGVTGPIILTLSGPAGALLEKEQPLTAKIDLKPALTIEQLDARIQRDFEKLSRKKAANSLDELLPQKMIPVMLRLAGIDGDKPVHQIKKEERIRLLNLLKGLEMTVISARPVAEAIVTAGGVDLKEVHPRTLESKKVPGLFLVGELLNLDGWTGGYNLQAAFSTGWAAAQAAALDE